MKTQYYAASSLDGFIATLDDSLDWLFPLANLEETSYPNFFKDVGAIAMGSATYEYLVKHIKQNQWPYTQPAWVFTSRKLEAIPGADITFVKGDVLPVYEQMKSKVKNKNIWIMGGGELVGQFYDAGLLDELIIQIGSVMLKEGKPLLPRKITYPTLRLVSVDKFGDGMAELKYKVQS